MKSTENMQTNISISALLLLAIAASAASESMEFTSSAVTFLPVIPVISSTPARSDIECVAMCSNSGPDLCQATAFVPETKLCLISPSRVVDFGPSGLLGGIVYRIKPISSFNAISGTLAQLGNRTFRVIQQRLKGNFSFARNWTEYEEGFGDDTDFWIGLPAINSLSKNGVTLRVEMKLLNGTRMYAEYSGFQVGNASTNYTMNYNAFLPGMSNVTFDAMGSHDVRGMQFSTQDRDNDLRMSLSCAKMVGGNGGWWFRDCSYFHPNGAYGKIEQGGMVWYFGSDRQALLEVRLMLQI